MSAGATSLIPGNVYSGGDSKESNNTSPPLPSHLAVEMLGAGLFVVWQIIRRPLTHPVSLRGGLETRLI